ncbi:MAG: hypothetical protein MK101_05350 [Phycisphaerales bacterium]|nr:hypothetical protein [Phycisphaerales bacterium]
MLGLLPAVITCLLSAQDAEAVFVDHAPLVERTLQQVMEGSIEHDRRIELLRSLHTEHGRRLTPRDTSDTDLFVQVDSLLQQIAAERPELMEAITADSTDPILHARRAAALGALMSARRWLEETDGLGSTRSQLKRLPAAIHGHSTIRTGDRVPDDLVDAPMWQREGGGNEAMALLLPDTLIIAGSDHIKALDVLTGEQKWHVEERASNALSSTPSHGGVQMLTAVPGGDFIVWRGQPVSTGFEGSGQVYRMAADTGHVQWRFDPAQLDDARGLIRPSGGPVVADGSVFIPMRRHGRAMQVESWLLSLDLETGQQNWARWLGSAGAAVRGVVWPGDTILPGERALFIQTGTGVLASIDPRAGDIDWLRRMTPGRWRARDVTAPPPWALFAPIQIGGHLITRASDGRRLLVLDPRTGDIHASHETSDQSDLAGVHTVHALDGAGLLTVGRSLNRWQVTPEGTLERVWTWRDDSGAVPSGRSHITDTEVLLPLGDQLIALHLDDGRPLRALHNPGGGHAISADGLIAMSSGQSLSLLGGLNAALTRLRARTSRDPDDIDAHIGIIALVVRAARADLTRKHLPGAMTAASAQHPSAGVDLAISSMQVLDASLPDDQALIDAAIAVIPDGTPDKARLLLARGDWIEPTSTDAAIESWLAADALAASEAWAVEHGVHAPVAALVTRRLARHGLNHAANWPPPSDQDGPALRACVARGDASRSQALALLSRAQGMEAIAVAHVAGFDPDRIEAMRDVVAPALTDGLETRRVQGGWASLPIDEGMMLREGTSITWHESPLTDALWSMVLDGTPDEVVAIDDDQIVITLDELDGGRRLQARQRDTGDLIWNLELDQLGPDIDPPIVIAATPTVAALAGRAGITIVDLKAGRPLPGAPAGLPLDALSVHGDLLLLLDDQTRGRTVLQVIDEQGRSHHWPLPPMIPNANWINRGPLGGVAVGNADSVAFAPALGDAWWWSARDETTDSLRGAIVLPDAIITRTSTSLVHRRSPETGALLGRVETPLGRSEAVVTDLLHLGDGLLVVTDQGVLRLGADGATLWADAGEHLTPPILATVAGDETVVFHARDVLHDTLLPMEDRTIHQVRRLDQHGRLMETIDLFPMAGRIRRAKPLGGGLLISDDLDTWLVPISSPQGTSPI